MVFPYNASAACRLFALYGGFSMAASFRRIPIVLLLVLRASFPLDSSAQQPSPASRGPLQLTLKQAVEMALKQNPQRVIAQLLVSESDRNRRTARSALFRPAGIAAW